MRSYLTAFVSAFLFAIGLGLGGMTNPANVIGFLDFAGDWNPMLMGVMGGGVLTYGIGRRFILRRSKPIFQDRFSRPQKTQVDGRLLVGGVLFGVGWGLSGICPGPAIVVLSTGAPSMMLFVLVMFVGFWGKLPSFSLGDVFPRLRRSLGG